MSLTRRLREPSAPGSGEKPPLLVLLHGRGADENDLFGLAPHLDGRFFVASPRAPYATPYGGYAWFELEIEPHRVSVSAREFEESLRAVVGLTEELVSEHDLDANRVYLCGFSQGAIIGLGAVLGQPERFAGLVAMSGRAMPEMLPSEPDTKKLEEFPVLVTHGLFDPVLPVDHGRATRDLLAELPVRLEYLEYEMGHQVSAESLRDVAEWLTARLDEDGR